MSYAMALSWAIVAAVLIKVVLTLTVSLRPGAETDIVNLGACEALVFVACAFVVLRLHTPEAPLRHAFGLRSTSAGLSVLGVVLGVSVHFPAESIRELVERLYPTPSEVLLERLELLSGSTPVESVLILFVVACVGPLVEELFFRGAVFGVLRRSHSLAGASIATAVAFTLGHPDPRTWPPLLVVAAVLTHLRAASGSLLPSLALHVGFNSVTIVAIAVGAASPANPMSLPPAATVAGWLVTAALIFWVQFIARRSTEAAAARASDES